ncbi:MAG: hypothetical protein JXQ90_03435 [Cyclobacteriaceae bacterium]
MDDIRDYILELEQLSDDERIESADIANKMLCRIKKQSPNSLAAHKMIRSLTKVLYCYRRGIKKEAA